MSLLNQASSWSSTIESKRRPKMKNTYNKIQNDIQEDISTNILETFEVQKNRNTKVQELLNKMSEVGKDSEESNLEDFTPLMPFSTSNENPMMNDEEKESKDVDKEGFRIMNLDPLHISHDEGSPYIESYRPTPYYQRMSNNNKGNSNMNPNVNNDLLEKLNYMIQLLEEQQKESTNNIIEEFLLYGLFTRVGKYVR